MILNWARQFAINREEHLANTGLVDLIRSITILDLSHYLSINTNMDLYHRHLDSHTKYWSGDDDEDGDISDSDDYEGDG